jgi:predicted nucleic acid-binding protein
MRFIDTSVLLYAVSSDPAESRKAEVAGTLLNEPDLALSVQVLQEFYVQATRPTGSDPVAHEAAAAFANTLLRFPVQENTVEMFRQAIAVAGRWQLNYWDSAIVAAAQKLGCDTLLTEDQRDGQECGCLRVRNPFDELRDERLGMCPVVQPRRARQQFR